MPHEPRAHHLFIGDSIKEILISPEALELELIHFYCLLDWPISPPPARLLWPLIKSGARCLSPRGAGGSTQRLENTGGLCSPRD